MGAIYGQIAGAFYGSEAIPKEWREKCSLSSLIGLFADELSRLSGELVPPEMPFHESTDWSVVNAPLPHDQSEDLVAYKLCIIILLCRDYNARAALCIRMHVPIL